MATQAEENCLAIGPQPRVSYPINVVYCGECGMPAEYCEYLPNYDKCKLWLEKNLPEEFEKLGMGECLLINLQIACKTF